MVHPRRARPRHRLPAVVMIALILALAACGEPEADREEAAMAAAVPRRLQPDGSVILSEADRAILGLQTARAETGTLATAVLRFGRVVTRPGDDALIVAPVDARLAEVPPVALGATVAKGTRLVTLVPVLGNADAASAARLDAEIEGARAELAQRESERDRLSALPLGAVVSAAEVQQAETAVATARAQLEALRRADAVQARGEGGRVILSAPVAGTVVTLTTTVGAVVHAGDPVARVLSGGPRWVDVAVPPTDPPGEGYEVHVGDGWAPASLVARGAVVEPDGTRRDRVELGALAAAALLPGQAVDVRVAQGAVSGVVVPAEAVMATGEGERVYVESGPGTYVPREVQVAARFGDRVCLTSGVAPEETVVTRGLVSLVGESLRGELRHED